MVRIAVFAVAVCVLSQIVCAQGGGQGATPEAAAQLPVSRVSLYKNGVGFFEHAGHVTGNASVTIDFTTAQLNDVLQTLTAIDLNGGRIAGAGYNSTTPVEQQLKALPLGLGEDATEVDFYHAIRGARVEVRGPGVSAVGRLLTIEVVQVPGRDGQPGGERRLVTVVSEGGEVRTVELTSATTVRLLDQDLHADVTRYLQLLASTRGGAGHGGLRHLTLQDNGTGTRSVLVSYLSEVPIWKSTYRILFTEPKVGAASAAVAAPKQTATLQGWSVVDNTTGADWVKVQLSLIAGSPQSFIQPLSVPYYSRRPQIALPQAAMLAPQTFESGESAERKAAAVASNGAEFATLRSGTAGGAAIHGVILDGTGAIVRNARIVATNTSTGVQTSTSSNANGDYTLARLAAGSYNLEVVANGFQRLLQENVRIDAVQTLGLNLKLTVGSQNTTVTTDALTMLETQDAAIGGTLNNELYAELPLSMGGAPRDPTAFTYLMPGTQYQAAAAASLDPNATTAVFDDSFAYTLAEPITIRKNESALVPTLQTKIDAERVTVWSQSAPRPLRALWITNTSALTLDRGSFSIVEDGNFGGEGLLEPIHPAETRLLSYAVDQAISVTAQPATTHRLRSVTIAKGILTENYRDLVERDYSVRNAATEARTVVIEQARNTSAGFELSDQSSAKPAETTPTAYRFRVAVPGATTVHLKVEESHAYPRTVQVGNINEGLVRVLVRELGDGAALTKELQPVLDAQRKVADLNAQQRGIETDLRNLQAEEERQRANISALKDADKVSQRRFVDDLNRTEDQLALKQKDQMRGQGELRAAQQALADLVQNLKFDQALGD